MCVQLCARVGVQKGPVSSSKISPTANTPIVLPVSTLRLNMALGLLTALISLLFAAIAATSPTVDSVDSENSSATPSSTSAAASASPTVPYASDDPNDVLWLPNSDIIPEAERGTLGATVIGPQNIQIDLMNADSLAPPTTDNGDV
jgi:hypothetical protein